MQNIYVAVPKPKYDAEVLVIQRRLNSIRSALLHDLPAIREDGYYGFETAKAVKAFQQACNISADEKFGPQTYASMMQKLREMPSIGPVSPKYYIGSVSVNPQAKPVSVFSIYDAADQFISAVKNFYSTLDSVAKDLIKMKDPSSRMVFNCFRGSLEKIDPALKKLKEVLGKQAHYAENSVVSDEIKKIAGGKTYNSHLSFQEQDTIRKASRAVSNANYNKRMAEHYLKEGMKAKDAILNNLKQYDFVSKIMGKLKSMGLTGKLDLSKVTMKGVGVAALLFSLKDIIVDIFNISEFFDDSKSEAWQEDLKQDCYQFLDNVIIGCISLFIAKLIVAVGAMGIAAAGATVSTVVIIVAVVIITLIIALIFSYVLSSKDISFTRFIFEDCAEFILSKTYGIPVKL